MSARSLRKGTTAVEFAVTAPILFLVVFGLIEFSRAYQLHAFCNTAAIAAARKAATEGATAQDVRDAAQSLLDSVGVNDATIAIDPPELGPAVQNVFVAVQIPVNRSNGFAFTNFLQGKTIRKEINRSLLVGGSSVP